MLVLLLFLLHTTQILYASEYKEIELNSGSEVSIDSTKIIREGDSYFIKNPIWNYKVIIHHNLEKESVYVKNDLITIHGKVFPITIVPFKDTSFWILLNSTKDKKKTDNENNHYFLVNQVVSLKDGELEQGISPDQKMVIVNFNETNTVVHINKGEKFYNSKSTLCSKCKSSISIYSNQDHELDHICRNRPYNSCHCRQCLFNYIFKKIQAGYYHIPCMYCLDSARQYKFDTDTLHPFYKANSIKSLLREKKDKKTLALFEKNCQIHEAVLQDHKPCSTPDCDGMLTKKQKTCNVCHQKFKKPKAPKGTNFCPNCKATYIITKGLDTIYCGYCYKISYTCAIL